jgi:hypothetical protein
MDDMQSKLINRRDLQLYAGYLHALDYARSRSQGRLPSAKNPIR